MSKVHEATCEGGIVTAYDLPIPGVTVLSEGVGPSTGVLIMDEKGLFYIPKGSPDLNATLEKLIAALSSTKDALDKAVAALNAIDGAGYIIAVSGGSGSPAVGTPSPPVAATDISGVEAAAAEIETIKGELEALKGQLI